MTDNLCIVGTDDGSGEGDYINTSALLVFDRLTGKLLDSHYGCKGDIRSNVSHDPDSDRVFFTSKGGYIYNAAIDWETGKITDFKSLALKDAEGKVLQTVTNDAEGNVSFNVEYNKAGEYRYTISEVVPEGAENNVKDHITYDTTEHEVTVTVNNGNGKLDATVAYDGGSPTPPTFTNKYLTTLPEAGGAGLTMTYLAGASMLCFAATWMHARRHRDLDRGGRRE